MTMYEPMNVRLFLKNGTLDGFIKAEINDWTGIVYHLPRQALKEHKDDPEIKQSGIYFLLGKNAQGERTVYVGQADKRSNGNGINQRLDEHTRDGLKDWQEAVYITTHGDQHGATELKYLEYRFHTLATQVVGQVVLNGQRPSPGNSSSTQQQTLEAFIRRVRLILSMLGHSIFDSATDCAVASVQHSTSEVPAMAEFWRTYKDVTAYARRSINGQFVLLADSYIVQETTPSCPQKVLAQREAAECEGALRDGRLIKDLAFRSPSAAAEFVCGTSMSGPQFWRDLRTNELLGACSR